MRNVWKMVGVMWVAAGLFAAGCDRAPAEATSQPSAITAEPNEARKPTESAEVSPYSPFGVELAESAQFDLISFKDVGLQPPESASRKLLFEAVAQSIAYQLKVDATFDVQPRVIYDEALADPNNHTYCEKDRLYVDIWHGTSPERWGYSLWSGCSEAQQFAWREIEDERAVSAKLDEAVEPLARGIVDSLAEAAENGCYRRAC